MKTLLLLPLAYLLLSFSGTRYVSLDPRSSIKNDSNVIDHKLDGKVDEWPAGKFSSNNETGIRYATDNDAVNLFIVISIPNFRTQVKMMRMGMSLYIDPKGKKKDSHGIEFPVKNGNADVSNQAFSGARPLRPNNDQQANEQQRKADIKVIRRLLASNLVELRIFGLSDKYPDGQQLLLPGSANIAFNWDSLDVMHVEYRIPLSMLGDIPSLDKKDISLGWKINAFEMPKGNDDADNSSVENSSPSRDGGYGGSRRPGGYGSGNGNSQEDREKMMGEQKFWTKYIINLPAGKKAF